MFWYDAEMGSGGHSGYFECYPETNPQELIKALETVNLSSFAANFAKAILIGKEDGYEECDRVHYQLKPELSDLLMKYINDN